MNNYKVCSWDVGIKNLAYCIINRDSTGKSIVEKWDIVNISNDVDLLCIICKKKATLQDCNNNTYCKRHKNNHVTLSDTDIIRQFTESNNNKCGYDIKDKLCNKTAKFTNINSNISYCKSHYNIISKRLLKENQLVSIKKKNCYNTSTLELSKNIVTKLDAIPELLQVDEILIENQPTLKNPTMKTIASFLYNYFTIRGIIDKKGSVSNIKFFSPSNKLKVNNDHTVTVLTGKNSDKQYKLTKNLAITYTNSILNNTKWIDYLNNYKKKDDLCDAFLQGYYHINYKLT